MDILEVMKARHSVRQYLDKPLEQELISELEKRLPPATKRAGCISSLLQTSRKPLTALWHAMGNSAA